jgi:hypothetical protein
MHLRQLYTQLTQEDRLQVLVQRVQESHNFRPKLEVKDLTVLSDSLLCMDFVHVFTSQMMLFYHYWGVV